MFIFTVEQTSHHLTTFLSAYLFLKARLCNMWAKTSLIRFQKLSSAAVSVSDLYIMCDGGPTNISNETLSDYDSNQTCLYELTEEQNEVLCWLKTVLDFYGQLIVCLAGLFFNSVTILLFFNKELSNVFFNRLLLCLSIIDNLYLIIALLEMIPLDLFIW